MAFISMAWIGLIIRQSDLSASTPKTQTCGCNPEYNAKQERAQLFITSQKNIKLFWSCIYSFRNLETVWSSNYNHQRMENISKGNQIYIGPTNKQIYLYSS
ncbi:unnamed protein product [Owenia fusiformis]|uniref:Uncharacterized protein n=1 Tax=Owenia fusiformis TaxID=6347 RepID=A0A8S4PZ11_OWEFU|nr:unnamed protein product [Owenia fusiformis]